MQQSKQKKKLTKNEKEKNAKKYGARMTRRFSLLGLELEHIVTDRS